MRLRKSIHSEMLLQIAQAMCREGIAASWSASWTRAPLLQDTSAWESAITSTKPSLGNIRGGASG